VVGKLFIIAKWSSKKQHFAQKVGLGGRPWKGLKASKNSFQAFLCIYDAINQKGDDVIQA